MFFFSILKVLSLIFFFDFFKIIFWKSFLKYFFSIFFSKNHLEKKENSWICFAFFTIVV